MKHAVDLKIKLKWKIGQFAIMEMYEIIILLKRGHQVRSIWEEMILVIKVAGMMTIKSIFKRIEGGRIRLKVLWLGLYICPGGSRQRGATTQNWISMKLPSTSKRSTLNRTYDKTIKRKNKKWGQNRVG